MDDKKTDLYLSQKSFDDFDKLFGDMVVGDVIAVKHKEDIYILTLTKIVKERPNAKFFQ